MEIKYTWARDKEAPSRTLLLETENKLDSDTTCIDARLQRKEHDSQGRNMTKI